MKYNLAKLAAAGPLTLAATASAMAGSVTQPGYTAGLALGATPPPGFYFEDTTNWGVRNGAGFKQSAGVTIPVIGWSTPWKVLGARVGFMVATPALEVSTTLRTPIGPVTAYNESLYNPFITGALWWDLGGGWGASYFLGSYIGVSNPLADKSSFLTNRGTLSYTANGWNLTASAVVGTALDTVAPVTPLNTNHPDYLNVDLTATKAFGKWEVGAVGFYSTDLDGVNQVTGYLKQSQFALGGLVGYDFGQLKTQVYLTRDVYQQNYGGYDTRVWGRLVVPLGDPFGPGSPGIIHHK